VPVIVRTQRRPRPGKACSAAGAAEVVPEAIEGSLMLASHALALVGVPMRRVIRVVQDQRDARYNLLRGYFHGADDDSRRTSCAARAPGAPSRCRWVPGPSASRSATWLCTRMGVRVVNLRRAQRPLSAGATG
jgi:CPA2 family monovalent cation:H+ antiporter-2